MPRSRSPRRNERIRSSSGKKDFRRRSSRSPKRRSRSYSPKRRRSRSYSPKRHQPSKRRSPSPRRKQSPPHRRPSGPRQHSPTSRHEVNRSESNYHRKGTDLPERLRERPISPMAKGFTHMSHETSLPKSMEPINPSMMGRDSHRSGGMRDRESPPRKNRSPPPLQVTSFRRSPSPVHSLGRSNFINSVTVVSPSVRRPLLTDRFREEDQIGPLRIDDNITIGIHRSGSNFKNSRKNMPVKRDFDPHCFVMVRKRDEGLKAIFDREEILEFERMMAEENERRMISVVESDDYHRTVSSSGGKASDKRSDTRIIQPSIEPKIRLDPKPDPRYEKLYKQSRLKEAQDNKRMERVQHNPNDLRHNLLKRRFDDDEISDDNSGFDARKRISAKRKDTIRSRTGGRERQRSRSHDRGHSHGDRKRSLDDRLGKGQENPEELPDFKNRPGKYQFENWKEKPEMIPKNPNYYEHDVRDENRSFRGRGRFPRYRGGYRGRSFSSSFRGRGRGRGGSANYETLGSRKPYYSNRSNNRDYAQKRPWNLEQNERNRKRYQGSGTSGAWKHDLYDKMEKDNEENVSESKKRDRGEERSKTDRSEKPSKDERGEAQMKKEEKHHKYEEKNEDNKPTSTT